MERVVQNDLDAPRASYTMAIAVASGNLSA